MKNNNSFSGFYKKTQSQRVELIQKEFNLSEEDIKNLNTTDISFSTENNIGVFSLPLGIAPNFLINGKNYIVPMVTEESSVIAACSFGAKIISVNGGFSASYSGSIMQGQVQVKLEGNSYQKICDLLSSHKEDLILSLNGLHESLITHGGKILDLSFYHIPDINSLITLIDINVCEAFGANLTDTICEEYASLIKEKFNLNSNLKILTNLCIKRMAEARCSIKFENLAHLGYDGTLVAQGIEEAYKFACYDQFRATTHNKGIMNGVDALLLATGNDTRAVEAATHSYASIDGVYKPLSSWRIDEDKKTLEGHLKLPISLGTVGGITSTHPCVKTVLKILKNPSVSDLSQIAVCVGLAQNLSALRALVSEGIQLGHMRLHNSNRKI